MTCSSTRTTETFDFELVFGGIYLRCLKFRQHKLQLRKVVVKHTFVNGGQFPGHDSGNDVYYPIAIVPI